MVEARENTEKHGVIFALWDGINIQLEKRDKVGSKYEGFVLVPGGVLRWVKL